MNNRQEKTIKQLEEFGFNVELRHVIDNFLLIRINYEERYIYLSLTDFGKIIIDPDDLDVLIKNYGNDNDS